MSPQAELPLEEPPAVYLVDDDEELREAMREKGLGTPATRAAIIEGLADGTIEILGSDHAPHCNYEKEVEFDYAPFGILGLETQLGLSLTELVHKKVLTLPQLIEKFTINPARLLRLNKGTLSTGADADTDSAADQERGHGHA